MVNGLGPSSPIPGRRRFQLGDVTYEKPDYLRGRKLVTRSPFFEVVLGQVLIDFPHTHLLLGVFLNNGGPS